MSERVPDYLILIGHAWICPDCRRRLIEQPESMIVGHKLSEDERERLTALGQESFRTMMSLAAATGLDMDEVSAAIDHPRSRLRHLGVRRRG